MSAELWAFIMSLGCGVAMMLLWDVLSGMRRVFAHGIIINMILDVFWWFASVSAFLWCMWKTVALELRFFEAFAVILGAVVYKVTLSAIAKKCFIWVFDMIFKIIKFILKILLTPVLFLYTILDRCILCKAKRGRKV